jgi:endonuclease YncB( thermonuclease family)
MNDRVAAVRSSFVIAAGAALALGLVVEFLPGPETPRTSARVAVVRLPPAAAAAATAIADAEPPSPAPAASPKPAPDLPTVAVTPHPVHTVPDHVPPAEPVIFPDRASRDSAAHPPRRAAYRPPRAAAPALTVSGPAQLGDALTLRVHGRSLPLFGVRLPAAGDRCVAAGSGTPAACGAAARAALRAQLGPTRHVSCRVPPGQQGHRDAAICLDAAGVDLGGFLIAEGLALADRRTSYDYVGAEGVARSLHRGLWRFR